MSGIEYEFEKSADRELTEGMAHDGIHAVYAQYEGDIVGRLLWDPETGELAYVAVEFVWRRQGIATKLWREAEMQAIMRGLARPHHRDVLMTADARAWVDSL